MSHSAKCSVAPIERLRNSLCLLCCCIAAVGFAADPFASLHALQPPLRQPGLPAMVNEASMGEDLLYRPTTDEEIQVAREIRKREIFSLPTGGRLPAEFEQQKAVLLSYRDLAATCPNVLASIVRELQQHIEVVILVASSVEHQDATRLFNDFDVALEHVRFAEVDYDTMWVRDYGPLVIEHAGGPLAIDSAYDGERQFDERVPNELARLLRLKPTAMPLRIAGGNLLSNGQGLALTTFRLIEENGGGPDDEAAIRDGLRRLLGLNELIILEPLQGETTGHVDMFATFTSPDTVIIAKCDPAIDRENAAILDRNAAILQSLPTPLRPLRVVRVPMPLMQDALWRSYTNVIYANGTVLVPCYPSIDEAWRQQVFDVFHQLLPTWRVVGIDAEELIQLAGALHCVTMNIGAIDSLPEFPRPQRHR